MLQTYIKNLKMILFCQGKVPQYSFLLDVDDKKAAGTHPPLSYLIEVVA